MTQHVKSRVKNDAPLLISKGFHPRLEYIGLFPMSPTTLQTWIFTDGAAKGNPGPGGWGAIVYDRARVKEFGGGEDPTTNNRMEMLSAIRALQRLPDETRVIRIFTDSSYLVQGATEWAHRWEKSDWVKADGKLVANRDLWEELLEAMRNLPRKSALSWELVKGHAGIPGNERADRIAVAFAEKRTPSLFEGSYEDYPIDLEALDPTPIDPYYLSWVEGALERHAAWEACEARVKGRKGAKFKKIKSRMEEEEILRQWGVKGK